MVNENLFSLPSTTIIFFLDFLFSIVGVLLGVAFFTLIERNIIGLIHYRKGPNNVLVWGVSQPIADAINLLTNEFPNFSIYKIIIFYSGPSVSIILMLLCWGWFDFLYQVISGNINIVLVFAIMGLSAYGFLLTSWGSNSNYALLGGHRAVAQIISYEVCLFLFVLTVAYTINTYSFSTLSFIQQGFWFSVFSVPLFLTWVILCIAEANRTPFDMAEGESEIVSGFNIEYGGGLFAFIFISEYGIIIFLSFITSLFFLGGTSLLLNTFLICFVFVWVRCSFPRVRYDNLIILAWNLALPYSLAMIALGFCII